MQPDYREIMASQYTRNARMHEAEQYRLAAEANGSSDAENTSEPIVQRVVDGVKQIAGMIAAAARRTQTAAPGQYTELSSEA